ncbi:LysM peptidoglycan-binding domain-containing protein, partial [Bordetella pertussis]|uniref:LysM peptidoglycan-binding domain-containing protein n=1 Tax=Bordetella pertussis TaxID=520 RepID=UPI0036702E0B
WDGGGEPLAVGALSGESPALLASARPNVRTHKVSSGDTLFGLARKYGTSVGALRALNNLKGNNLKLGSQLRIPGTGTRG